MRVEHERDEGALELRGRTEVEGEPRTGDLRRSFPVQNAQGLTDVPMGFGREGELRLRSPPIAHELVVLLARAVRHGSVRDVGDGQEQGRYLLLDAADFLLPTLHLLAEALEAGT